MEPFQERRDAGVISLFPPCFVFVYYWSQTGLFSISSFVYTNV